MEIQKQNGSAAARIVNQFSPNQAKQITTEVLSQPKDPKDYQNRVVHENEQPPIEFPNEESPIKIPNEEFQPKVVEIRTIDDSLIKKRAEKQKELERQLSENTARLKKTKKQKAQEMVNLIYLFLLFNKVYSKKMPYFQLPYGFVKNNKHIQFNLPRNY